MLRWRWVVRTRSSLAVCSPSCAISWWPAESLQTSWPKPSTPCQRSSEETRKTRLENLTCFKVVNIKQPLQKIQFEIDLTEKSFSVHKAETIIVFRWCFRGSRRRLPLPERRWSCCSCPWSTRSNHSASGEYSFHLQNQVIYIVLKKVHID